MNKKVKTITSWLAVTVFLFALAINVKVTLDDPFVLLSDEAVATTSSSSDPNYTYFAKLTASPVYGNVAIFENGCTIPIEGIPIGLTCSYETSQDVVGHLKNCTFFLTSKCDQSKVGYFPIEVSCSPCS
jgi:hypothetical protein